jgi:succinoglycan biosynthesis transport protein ExoP
MNTPATISRIESGKINPWTGGEGGQSLATSSGPISGGDSHKGPINKGRILSTLRHFWWVILLTWLLIGLPIGVYEYLHIQPTYTAQASVRVAPTTQNPVNDDTKTTPFYTEFLRTQVEMLQSPKTFQKAADDPRLKSYPWFSQLPDQISFLQQNLAISLIPSSQLISISMNYHEPAAATDIVNSVMDAYLKLVAEDEEHGIGKQLSIIKSFRDTTEKSLKDAQDKKLKLMTDASSMSSDDQRALINNLLGTSRNTLAKLQSDQVQLKATLDALQSQPPVDEQQFKKAIPLNSDAQLNEWQGEKMRILLLDEQATARGETARHPDRLQYKKEIADLDSKIAARTVAMQNETYQQYASQAKLDKQKRLDDMTRDVKANSDQIKQMTDQTTDLEKSAADLNQKLMPIMALNNLISDAQDNLKRYDGRIQELESQNFSAGRIDVGWTATQPITPSADKRIRTFAIANVSGILIGVAILGLLTLVRNYIVSSDDLPEHLLPLLVGTVSHAGPASRGSQRVLRGKVLSEEMRLVHANLLPAGKHERRVIMVTSPTPGNGKTSISSQLAISLAKSGLEVLLIDADLRKRDLTQMLDSGLGFRPGLSELLQNQTPEIIRPIELLPNFRFMGAGGKLTRNPAELFQSKQTREVLDSLAERYDAIIIDTPPTLVVADARLMAPSADEVICVVRAQVSSKKEITQTIDALSRVIGRMPKLIVNGVEQQGSYYKHKYSYTDALEADPLMSGPTAAGR